MADIKSPRLLFLKGFLFLGTGLAASVLLLLYAPSLQVATLLLIAVWSFCRFYYFAFYVIEHYVDPHHRYAGLSDFLKYTWRSRFGAADPIPDRTWIPQSGPETDEND